MSKHAPTDRVVETLIGATILGRQEVPAEFTAEEVAHYFSKAQTPDPQVDGILSLTPPTVSALLASEQADASKAKTVLVQAGVVLAMNRNNSSDEQSEVNREGLDVARCAALKRLQKKNETDTSEDNAQ